MKKTLTHAFGLVLLMVLNSACGSVTVATPTIPGQLETVVASTLKAYTELAQNPTTAATQQFTTIPIPSVTTEGVGERYVYTAVDNVNLRVGPGTLFKVSRVLLNNTKLKLLGRAPGAEWLQVMNDENIIGWVYVDWVKGGFEGSALPIIQPADVILVSGTVLDASASPVTGIGFAVTQGSRRVDASTDSSGQFYAYLPSSMSGVWSVGFVSIACTSNTMDANCKCIKCGKPNPESVNITLPPTGVLNFVWK